MRHIKLFMILLLISTAIKAGKSEGIIFEKCGLEEAIQMAAKNKKGKNLLFVDCYTSWCGPCKQMAANIFTQKEVGEYFNSNFINLKIDMEREDGPQIAKKYGVKSYPTCLILDAEGREVARVIGSYSAEEFINKVKTAIKDSPAVLREKYENDKCVENAVPYLKTLMNAQKTSEINSFLSSELKLFDIGDRYSPDMWPFVSAALMISNPDIFDIVIDDIAEANMLVGKDIVSNSLKINTQRYIIGYIVGKNSDVTPDNLMQRIRVLGMVCDSKDVYSLTLKQIAKAVMNNDYSRMAGTLSPFKILTLDAEQVATLEYVMMSISDRLDPNIITEYFNAASNLAKGEAAKYDEIIKERLAKKSQTTAF